MKNRESCQGPFEASRRLPGDRTRAIWVRVRRAATAAVPLNAGMFPAVSHAAGRGMSMHRPHLIKIRQLKHQRIELTEPPHDCYNS